MNHTLPKLETTGKSTAAIDKEISDFKKEKTEQIRDIRSAYRRCVPYLSLDAQGYFTQRVGDFGADKTPLGVPITNQPAGTGTGDASSGNQ